MRVFCPAICVLLLCAANCAAHVQAYIEAAKPFHVLAYPTDVYASMHQNGVVIAHLPAGTKVSVLEHKEDGWQLVNYDLERPQSDGYVLANPYLQNTGIKYRDVYFTFTVEKTPENEATLEYGYGGTLTLYAHTNDGLAMGSHSQKVRGYVDYPVFKAQSSHNLANVEMTLTLSFKPDFRGAVYEYAWGWDGENYAFMPLPPVMSQTGPAGDWYAETLFFPDQGAINNVIVKTVMQSAAFNDAYHTLDAQYYTQVYIWDGAKAIPQTQSDIMRNWQLGD